MSSPFPAGFDPYYEWLGIPREEQPADHYRLLGVPRFEHNERVIANAYDQRMYFLRTKQLGQFVQLSQQLQCELTVAQRVLLNPAQRVEYDARLAESLRSATLAEPLRTAAASAVVENLTLPRRVKPSSKRPATRRTWPLGFVLGFAAIFGVTCLLAVLGRDPAPTTRTSSQQADKANVISDRRSSLAQGVGASSRTKFDQRKLASLPASRPSSSPTPPQIPTKPSAPAGRFVLRFDGVDDRIELSKLNYRGDTALTLEAWASFRRMNGDVWEVLICDFEHAGVGLSNHLGFNLPRPYQWGFSAFADGYKSAAQREPLPVDTLLHLAGVFVPNRHVQFYVNGKLQSSTAAAQEFKPSVFPLVIGANPHPGGSFEHFFAGDVAMLRVSSSARYVGDFVPERTVANDRDTLALYRFDEGAGDKLNDSSGREHHGKIAGPTWVRVP